MVTVNNTGIFKSVYDYGSSKNESIDPDIELIGNIPFDQCMQMFIISSSTFTFTRKFMLWGFSQAIRLDVGDLTTSYGVNFNIDGTNFGFYFRHTTGAISEREQSIIFTKPILLKSGDTIVSTGNAAPSAYSGVYFGYYVD